MNLDEYRFGLGTAAELSALPRPAFAPDDVHACDGQAVFVVERDRVYRLVTRSTAALTDDVIDAHVSFGGRWLADLVVVDATSLRGVKSTATPDPAPKSLSDPVAIPWGSDPVFVAKLVGLVDTKTTASLTSTGARYRWSASSVVADNSVDSVKPSDVSGAGRWLKL